MEDLSKWEAIVGVKISPLTPHQKSALRSGRFVLPDGQEASCAEVVQFDAFVFRQAELPTRMMPTPRGERAHATCLRGIHRIEQFNLREPLTLLRMQSEASEPWAYFSVGSTLPVESWGSL